jgi:hypothetical protein
MSRRRLFANLSSIGGTVGAKAIAQRAGTAVAIIGCICALSLPGCYSPGLLLNGKTTKIDSPTQPTINTLVDHLACEIGKAYNDNTNQDFLPSNTPAKYVQNPNDSAEVALVAKENQNIDARNRANAAHIRRWQQLVKSNFVASIDLNLMVTRTEGLNPSASYIWPLTGSGNSPPSITYSSPTGTGVTTATNNFTLALGGQLNSTADRNVEQDFMIDLRTLIDQYNFGKEHAEDSDAESHYQADYPRENGDRSAFPYCMRGAKLASREAEAHQSHEISSNPLDGNMALLEMIDDGLTAIDRSAVYNVYGTSGPTRLADVVTTPSRGQSRSLGLLSPMSGSPAGSSAAASGAGSATAGKTTFGSKVDFYIVAGYNFGPSYSILNWKVSGGAGGGGAGAAAGGGGAGGAGGGGGQLLTFNRQTQDSLTVTFGATCDAPLVARPLAGFLHTIASPRVSLAANGNSFVVPGSAEVLGWKTGMPVVAFDLGTGAQATAIPANTTILSIAQDTSSFRVTMSQSATGTADVIAVPPVFRVTLGQIPNATGVIPASRDSISFTDSVTDKGWYAGMRIDGDGIDPGTGIKAISEDGRVIYLTVPANRAGNTNVLAYFSPLSGQASSDPSQPSDLIFASNVLSQGWRKGMPVAGLGIPLGTTIASIEDGGYRVTLSVPVTAGTHLLTVYVTYSFTVTTPHNILLGSPGFSSGVISTIGAQAADLISVGWGDRTFAYGTVQWTGEVLSNGDFALRGVISSGASGQAIGQVWLSARADQYSDTRRPISGLVTQFPEKLVAKLNDDAPTGTYWDSVPSCDTITATQKQGAIDAIDLQNQFQSFFGRR